MPRVCPFPEVLWARDQNAGEEDLSVVPQQMCRLPPLPRITPVWLCGYDPPPPAMSSPAALDTEERGVPFTCMAIGSDQQLLQCEPSLGSSCGLQQGLSPGPLTLLQVGPLPPPSFQNPPEMELQPQARTCHRRQCLPALPGEDQLGWVSAQCPAEAGGGPCGEEWGSGRLHRVQGGSKAKTKALEVARGQGERDQVHAGCQGGLGRPSRRAGPVGSRQLRPQELGPPEAVEGWWPGERPGWRDKCLPERCQAKDAGQAELLTNPQRTGPSTTRSPQAGPD